MSGLRSKAERVQDQMWDRWCSEHPTRESRALAALNWASDPGTGEDYWEAVDSALDSLRTYEAQARSEEDQEVEDFFARRMGELEAAYGTGDLS